MCIRKEKHSRRKQIACIKILCQQAFCQRTKFVPLGLPDPTEWSLINTNLFFRKKISLLRASEKNRWKINIHSVVKIIQVSLTCNYQISRRFTLTLLNAIDYLLCKITEGRAIYILARAPLQAHKLWKCSEEWVINNIYTSCEVEAIKSPIKLDLADAYWNGITKHRALVNNYEVIACHNEIT